LIRRNDSDVGSQFAREDDSISVGRLFHERFRINDPDDASRLIDKLLLFIVSGKISELIDGLLRNDDSDGGSRFIDELMCKKDSDGTSESLTEFVRDDSNVPIMIDGSLRADNSVGVS
jgi:hypothetical protein